MYFQIVDNNEKCLKMYFSGDLADYKETPKLSKTWKHSPHLSGREDVDYALLYTTDGNIDNACPGFVEDAWNKSSSKISAIMKSTMIAQCDIENNCIYDFVPENFLLDFLLHKEVIIKHIFNTFKKPMHYDALYRAHILAEEMNANKNIFEGQLRSTNYNIFGTKTGRLSNPKSEIPILNLKREDRHLLEPTNDLFLEFDYNAAELRTLLALGGKQQPSQDIHEWTAQKGGCTRDEVKKRTFAWLYNPAARDSLLEGLYDRNRIKDMHYSNGSVITPFKRKIETDDKRALNYIVQSTSSDLCIEQAYKLRNFFQNCRTKICYFMHDSVILDFAKEDRDKFVQAKEIFSNTRLGKYRVNASIGKNFGAMSSV